MGSKTRQIPRTFKKIIGIVSKDCDVFLFILMFLDRKDARWNADIIKSLNENIVNRAVKYQASAF